MAGEIRFENLLVRKMPRDKRTVKSIKTMVFYGLRRKMFPVPKEIKYLF
jgi:hypothetical protein